MEKGYLGDIIEVDTVLSFFPLMSHNHPRWVYDLPGGIVGEIIPHGVYTELAFLKSVSKVKCLSTIEPVHKSVPFKDMAILMFSDGGLGRLLLTSRMKSSFTIIWVNIIGSERSLAITIPSGSLVDQKLDGDSSPYFRAKLNLSSAWQLTKGTIRIGLQTAMGRMHSYVSYENISRMFIRSVLTDTEPPVTPEQGREVVKVTEMIWEDLCVNHMRARSS